MTGISRRHSNIWRLVTTLIGMMLATVAITGCGSSPSTTEPTKLPPAGSAIDDPEPGVATGSAGDPGAGTSVGSPLPSEEPAVAPPGCPPERVFFGRPPESADPSPLLAFTPEKATLCTYDVAGAIGVRTVDDPTELLALRDDLNALEIPGYDIGCTSDFGPAVAIVATRGDRTETVWVEFYGCGIAHNGDAVRIGARRLSDLAG